MWYSCVMKLIENVSGFGSPFIPTSYFPFVFILYFYFYSWTFSFSVFSFWSYSHPMKAFHHSICFLSYQYSLYPCYPYVQHVEQNKFNFQLLFIILHYFSLTPQWFSFLTCFFFLSLQSMCCNIIVTTYISHLMCLLYILTIIFFLYPF